MAGDIAMLPVRIAVAGNPNTGKSSLFNGLTGLSQSVANYPGVTVEIRRGKARLGNRSFSVVDLPGAYSLSAASEDERVALESLTTDRPDAVLDVVDASNLARNLYLTLQLIETGAPVVVALNMTDVAKRRGLHINLERLSARLGARVVPTVASRGKGFSEVLAACGERATEPDKGPTPVFSYGEQVEGEIEALAQKIATYPNLPGRFHSRGAAIRLLEGDDVLAKRIEAMGPEGASLPAIVAEAVRRIEQHAGTDAPAVFAQRRHEAAAEIERDAVQTDAFRGRDLTDRIDAIVCNRLAGPAILLATIYCLFVLVFKVGDEWGWLFGRSPKGWIDEGFAGLAGSLRTDTPLLGSLVADGLIGGVGGVVTFLPLIAILFFCIAILEDSGYVARVAFLLDRMLRIFGLQGRSVLALVVAGGLGGGGCAAPGLMAARAIPDSRDRLVTILVAPFMNCGAKVPVHLLLVGAFFVEWRALALFCVWVISWVFAGLSARLLRRFLVRGEPAPFVLELPPYHRPTLKAALFKTWERSWMFLRKAGTILLAVNVVLWAFMCFPALGREKAAVFEARLAKAKDPAARASIEAERSAETLRDSAAGRFGRALEPATLLAGFDWRENVALLGGLAAKEVIVGTLGTAYSLGETDPGNSAGLSTRLRTDPSWTPLRAIVTMIFVLLYSPCIATLAVMRRETGGWKWPIFSTFYTTALAFGVAILVFQAGRLLGWGISS